jgi:hypothetical protein
MKIIVCNLNLFTANSPVMIMDTETSQTEMLPEISMSSFIPSDLLAICRAREIYELKLAGPAGYTRAIANEIATLEEINYSENKINVEIIE